MINAGAEKKRVASGIAAAVAERFEPGRVDRGARAATEAACCESSFVWVRFGAESSAETYLLSL